jgi:tetratricopeptide (TPR) repeat protein
LTVRIVQEQNKDPELAEAYRAYGFFFRSSAVERHKHYESGGFLEPGATYQNRHDKSIEYFSKAAEILEKYQKHDRLSNIYFNMGVTYEAAQHAQRACDAYTKSVSSLQRFLTENPGAQITLPPGYQSFEELVNPRREKLQCTGQDHGVRYFDHCPSGRTIVVKADSPFAV